MRERISAAVTANHPSKLHPELWAENALRNLQTMNGVSKLEKRIAKMWPGGIPQYVVAGHRFDFGVPAKQILLEVNGCWWHCCSLCHPVSSCDRQRAVLKNDAKKRALAGAAGWKIITIWEHEITEDIFAAFAKAMECPC